MFEIYVNKTNLKHKSYSPAVSELARALFLVESTNSTKMHRAPTECWMHYFMITMYIDSLVTKILKQ